MRWFPLSLQYPPPVPRRPSKPTRRKPILKPGLPLPHNVNYLLSGNVCSRSKPSFLQACGDPEEPDLSSRPPVRARTTGAHLDLYLQGLAGRHSFGLKRIFWFPSPRLWSSDCLPYLALKGRLSFKEKQRSRDPDTAERPRLGRPSPN